MKKLLSIAFLLGAFAASSQTATLAKTYSVQNLTPGGKTVRSIVYGNCLYNVYTEGNVGLSVQKNDLNGVPVTKTRFANIFLNTQNGFFLNTYNGDLYISGAKTGTAASTPFLIKIDTASCNFVYLAEYPVSNYNNVKVTDSKILSNGNVVFAGSVSNTGTVATEHGIIFGANLATNGTLAHTSTLAIGGNTNTIITSITEISNSTVIFAATSLGQPYLGRALKTATNLTITGAYATSSGGGKVAAFGNQKKFLAYNATHVYKVDTNLTILSLPHPGVNLGLSALSTHYLDNKVYRILSGSKLEIVDTAFTSVSNTYSSIVSAPASFAQSVAKNSTNLFINYSDMQTTFNFYLIKTNLAGQMNCSMQQTTNPVTTATNGGSVTIVTGSIVASTVPTTPTSPTASVTYVNSCSTVGIKEAGMEKKLLIANNNGVYTIEAPNAIAFVEIFDISGKLIQRTAPGPVTSVSVDMTVFAKSIYIVKLSDIVGGEYKAKLVN
jgi:hypothetical protein